MNSLYNFGIHLFQLGVKLAATYRPKVNKMAEGHKHTLQTLREAFPQGTERPVWFHAASLGEFEQARPLIERLRRERPDVKILLTFFSPSGYEVRKNYKEVDCVCYLPIDTPANARRFIDAANPSMAIFVKYEFWGNYLQQLHRRGIPAYIISAIFRRRQSFFKWWGGMFRSMLRCYDHLYVQDNNSRALLADIGVENVTVAGDTRFDRVTDILRTATPLPCIEPFAARPGLTLIAGSSWGPDEEVYLPWANSRPDVRLIVASHEIDEARLQHIERAVKGRTVRYSELERDPQAGIDAKCILVDCFGKLSSLYRYGSIAYIGGGFGVGIHNINEAAVYGIPVVFGPNHSKFKEAHDLIECGGGFSVSSRTEAETILTRLADNKSLLESSGNKAGTYIKEHLGATDRIYRDLFQG